MLIHFNLNYGTDSLTYIMAGVCGLLRSSRKKKKKAPRADGDEHPSVAGVVISAFKRSGHHGQVARLLTCLRWYIMFVVEE